MARNTFRQFHMARFPGLLHVFRATLPHKFGVFVTRCYLLFGKPRRMPTAGGMQSALVRAIDGAERMQLSFKYTSPVNGKERLYNFDRALDEHIDVTAARIAANVAKTLNKKKRKQSQEEKPELTVDVALFYDDVEVDRKMPNNLNKNVWRPGARLRVGDAEYVVVVNPPTVSSMRLPHSVMAGSFICPEVKLEFAELAACRFVWYREKPQATPKSDGSDSGCVDELGNNEKSRRKRKASKDESPEWEEIHEGYLYSTKDEDVGHRLQVVCFPASNDVASIEDVVYTATTESPVYEAPGFFPFQRRQEHTHTKTPSDRFRVMSYNILADLYADSDFSRDCLFSHCPPEVLSHDYRKPLLIREILGYNSDLILMQEVDEKFFKNDLSVVLGQHGFTGQLKVKAGDAPEGSAIFYRTSKFKLTAQHDLNISEALRTDPLCEDLLEKLHSSEALEEKVITKGTALQVCVLESTDNSAVKLIVATTHLYFHPRAPHVRLLQTMVCLRHLHRVKTSYQQQGHSPAVIFCGDFNSSPVTGVYQLITTKHIPSKHADWFAGGKEEFCGGIELEHQLDLVSVCGCPPYTNFVPEFQGCLDYIFVEPDRLPISQVVPMPSHAEVTDLTALPNKLFPSDHIAIVCDLFWPKSQPR